MTIGQRIKKLRLNNNKTQLDISKILDVNFQTVYKYEKDIVTPPAETLSKLAEYFNVTVDYLLGRTDIPRTEKYKHLENTLIGRVSTKMEKMNDEELELLDKLVDKLMKSDK